MSAVSRVLTCGGVVAGGVAAAAAFPELVALTLGGKLAAVGTGALAGIASNVLAGDLHAALVEANLDPLVNRDLRRVVGEAHAATARPNASREEGSGLSTAGSSPCAVTGSVTRIAENRRDDTEGPGRQA